MGVLLLREGKRRGDEGKGRAMSPPQYLEEVYAYELSTRIHVCGRKFHMSDR